MGRKILFVLLLLQVGCTNAYTAYSECDRHSGGMCNLGHPNGLTGTLKVAVAQTTSNSTDTLEVNAQKHADWLDIAGKEGARVILFPELSMTGYFAESVVSLTGHSGSADVANKRLKAAENVVAKAAKKNNIYAIIGIPVFFDDVSAQNPKPWYNTALVIGPNGTKEYRQAKLFPCCNQDGAAGSWIDIFNISNFDGSIIPVATQICFDDFHPEIVRLQAMAGAQILFYSSWESDVSVETKLSLGDKLGSAQAVVPGHAAVNQMFILQSNAGAQVDTMISELEPGYEGIVMGGSHGQSRIVDPNGIVLEQARVFGQQLLVHELDLTLLSAQKHRMVKASKDHKVFGPMWKEGLSQFNRMKIEW